ncbi:MAG: ABC transporter permease [Oligoflexales bacterium]
MLRWFLQRFLSLCPMCLCLILITASMMDLIPGDPVDQLLGDFATLEEKTALRSTLKLDQSLWDRQLSYLLELKEGSLGSSLLQNRSVLTMILERIPATIELALASILFALLMSLPLGFIAALSPKSFIDKLSMFISMLGVSIPNFWLGPLFILFFSLYLGWFPVSERTGWISLVLPAMTLGTSLAAILTRMTRNSILDTLGQDYIRTARGKGLKKFHIMVFHIFINAAQPIITIVGLQFGALLTGAVITEKIFDWPGLGTLMLEALGSRDYPVIQGCLLFYAFSYLLINTLTDFLLILLDPPQREKL